MMDDKDSLEYAQARLALAKYAGDTEEVFKWREHVKFWKEKINNEVSED